MEDSLQAIAERLRQFRDDRDWSQFHRLTHLSAALAIEVAELQELFLWASPDGETQVLDTRRDEVQDELADVVITAMNFALAADIDVADAVWSKISQNEERYPVEKARGRATKYTQFGEGPR